MYYVYILRSDSTGKLYKGSTEDLQRRLEEHTANMASATKNRGPWKLVYYETYPTRSAAMLRERYFNTGKGREELSRLLAEQNPLAAVSSRRGGVESAAAELLISRLGVLRRGGLTAHQSL